MEFRELGRDRDNSEMCKKDRRTETEKGKRDLQKESVREDVLKLTTLCGNIRE